MSDKFTHPADLRQLMADKSIFPATPQTLDSFFLHHHTHLTRGFSPAPPHPPPPLPPKSTSFHPLQLVLTDPAALPDGLLHYAGGGGGDGGGSSTATAAAASSAPFFRRNKLVDSDQWSCPYGNDVVGGSNNGGANSRWPRQETLTLLEIRSRLDSKFKESNQKGPLWDQVSRMMAEEYGYKRSGKKCKEKFDNLYKYYKKTKEGKTGRHDGKHYRFFRQLEAIYGECNDQLSTPTIESNFYINSAAAADIPAAHHQEAANNNNNNIASEQKASGGGGMSLSFSISSDFETSSSGNYHDDDLSAIAFMMNQRRAEKARESNNDMSSKGEDEGGGGRRGGWREEVEKMVDSKLSRLMEVQENWMEKIMASVEDGEKERILKEEEWRKKEVARFDNEMNEFCARERAWLQAREAAFMEIVKRFSGKGYD